MHAYELVYIARPTADDTALATLTEKLNNLIQTAGGELTARDDWGKRRLAFPIRNFREGLYSVLKFNFPPTALRDLERALQLTDDILRYLIVRLEA